jgi:hypothetical protein
LYNNLLHKSEFGQVHYVEWFKRIRKSDFKIFGHSYKFLKFETISGIYLNKNEKEKGVNRAWAESGPWLWPFGEAAHRPLRSGATQ